MKYKKFLSSIAAGLIVAFPSISIAGGDVQLPFFHGVQKILEVVKLADPNFDISS